MSNSIFVNPGALYEKAAEAAERALVVDAGQGYGLEDIADEDTLVAAFSSSLVAPLLVEGTLTGCLAAFTHTPNAVIPPLGPNAVGPNAVNHDDMSHAHALLSASVGKQLDDSQRSGLIRAQLPSGYFGDPTRMTSVVLALVTLADEIVTHARQ
ncbi:hypothetical protein [Plantibacter sp. RU18]|uniref:hypothetical protein n=1 Tax=Plantibacter sp. RU18 TaxID=3158143 RepID=UPI002BF525D7|nr:hypothetical protein [Gemmatimonadaceae bacterium]